MCGFVVSIGDVNKTETINATNSIKYRGPDETNFYIDESKKIYVGHNRLSIMDPEFGKQPLKSEDGKIIVAYNGEIYNQFELRKELTENNFNFKSVSSDTEVILKGYQYWGNGIFEKLDGQYAISIIDLKKNKLILSRDKFGEKPLFYYLDKKKIIVGSELKIFSRFKDINIKIDTTSLKKYFIYSFVPAPMTIYKNILKVKHSEVIEINLGNKILTKYNYYKPEIIKNYDYSKEDFIENLDSIIDESVKSRLLSDSKIGVFLSGGLDSSLISFYTKKYNQNLESFSISVKEKSFDEIDKALEMSRILKIKLNQTEVNKTIFENDFDTLLKKLDEPIGAPTYIPMFFLSKLTKKYVKSVLSGDGADEMFGGYENFKYLNIFRQLNKFKLNKSIAKLNSLSKFLPVSKKNLSMDFKLRRFSQGMEVDEKFQNTFFLSPLSISDFEDLFNEKFDFEETLKDIIDFENTYKDVNYLDKTYLYFVNFYIPDLISARADKAGMLNSLEIRSPFLNSKILELMLSIPKNKSYLLKDKTILKEIILKKFNCNFFKVKKGGFTYPLQKWLDVSKIEDFDFFNRHKFLDMKSNHLENKAEYRNFFHCCKVMKNFI